MANVVPQTLNVSAPKMATQTLNMATHHLLI